MEHIAAFLLLVGCSNGDAECRELPSPTPVFETLEDCEAVRLPAIGHFTSRYPRVLGKCIEVDPAQEYEDATIVWDVLPNGRLQASIERENFTVAGNFQSREKDLVGQQ